MNRYPLWKYIVILVALLIGAIYSIPNLFGEVPAIQIAPARSGLKMDSHLHEKIDAAFQKSDLMKFQTGFEDLSQEGVIRIRFSDTDAQLKAKDIIEKELNPDHSNPDYIVALALVSNTPNSLMSINALPMPLGLDLRGGVYFLLKVDMQGALEKKLNALASDARTRMRDKSIRYQSIDKSNGQLLIKFASVDEANKAKEALTDGIPDMSFQSEKGVESFLLNGIFRPESINRTQENALKQNIITLNKRVNELAVKEPVIQKQGADRIVVQLPGVQDTARAKDIIGRTATLEARLADPLQSSIGPLDTPPVGMDAFKFGDRQGVFKKGVIITGDRIIDASAGFDQNQRPSVNLTLDAAGGRAMQEMTRENLQKPMGMILFEKGKGEVLTIATIQGEFGSKFQITGQPTTQSANDLALLLRAGSLAAPMEIIEERTIGPSLGAENIEKGFKSLVYGFIAIAIFMVVYYMLFGLFSVIALAVNLLLLIAVLSMLQATLSLPGIAAMALALGMAIDSNVLINERIREELRQGASPQIAISTGFEKAWATIFDSNVTTLIAGLALLAFGSGPIKGFAIVHCLGILTSMFSAVFFSRGLVNLWYGSKKKLQSVSIG
jgi:preprotein translocase subunit SecD